MLEAVSIREIEAIFAVTDRLGIHREMLVIPLMPKTPGRVRVMPNGKLEIVVDATAEFSQWVTSLEAEIQKVRP